MKSITEQSGSAFPTPDRFVEQGMTLRDYFAAKAMQSMILTHRNDLENMKYEDSLIARMAWSFADAMLKEREK